MLNHEPEPYRAGSRREAPGKARTSTVFAQGPRGPFDPQQRVGRRTGA
ncbi:hypothetical protein DFJ64_0962 [Thermasporomyces composti]|jgi:hypothetical protein|uniref:Uncharacterized protein n=1 Tax=Thermasporomyces composti TaxID=696763 RepID=A0A3D9VE28_THECX|nr:hypothetical protein DFJ64_0962 [Thermasporomyces composti]